MIQKLKPSPPVKLYLPPPEPQYVAAIWCWGCDDKILDWPIDAPLPAHGKLLCAKCEAKDDAQWREEWGVGIEGDERG